VSDVLDVFDVFAVLDVSDVLDVFDVFAAFDVFDVFDVSLKAADIGVAMGITGTDVSKEAAKIVLADDNFCSIVEAVREGRRVWDNLRKIMILNVAANLAQGLAIFGAFVVGLEYAPLTAVGVLYVNMVHTFCFSIFIHFVSLFFITFCFQIVSVTVGLTIAFEPAEEDIMSRPPRLPSKPLNGKLFLWRTEHLCFFNTKN
jgi:magnesium-transporting ATPase (P-type)